MTEVIIVIVTTIGSIAATLITVGLPLLSKSKKESRQVIDELKAIKTMTANISAQMDGVSNLSVATARAKLNDIYLRYYQASAMPKDVWEAVCEIHDAYKSVTIDGHVPNSWADSLYEEMRTWEKL